MRRIKVIALIMALVLVFCSCGGKSASAVVETAALEEEGRGDIIADEGETFTLTLYADLSGGSEGSGKVTTKEISLPLEETPGSPSLIAFVLADELTEWTGLDFTLNDATFNDDSVTVDWSAESTLIAGLGDREQKPEFQVADAVSLNWFMMDSMAMTLKNNLDVSTVFYCSDVGPVVFTNPEDMAAQGLPELPVDQPYEGSAFYVNHSGAQASTVAIAVDQYYANENFMIEMLINDDCVVEENGSNLMISTSEGHAAVILSLIPGIQNLSAAAALASQTVQNGIPGAALGEVADGNLFGARAKLVEYEVAGDSGDITLMGLEAAAIVNQSCYFVNMMMEPGVSEAEGELITGVFWSMNVLRPAQVDQNAKQAVYTSHYQPQLDAKTVKTSAKSKAKPVNSWSSLPYYYYSGFEGRGDYLDYPAWYYEPDWDYYSDPGDYWDWGWDDSYDWSFYDDYSDYYSYDYYHGYDDYWDDYDPWSDPGDTEAYGYWDEDPWSDPGDTEDYGYWDDDEAYGTYDDGYGDYAEDDGWGDYVEDDGWGDYAEDDGW